MALILEFLKDHGYLVSCIFLVAINISCEHEKRKLMKELNENRLELKKLKKEVEFNV